MGAYGGEEIWWGNLRKKSHLDDLDVDGMDVKSIERVWTGLTLWPWSWTFTVSTPFM
jgi:hypothetical protein